MKQKFEPVELEILSVFTEDVIRTSSSTGSGSQTGGTSTTTDTDGDLPWDYVSQS